MVVASVTIGVVGRIGYVLPGISFFHCLQSYHFRLEGRAFIESKRLFAVEEIIDFGEKFSQAIITSAIEAVF